MANKAARRRQRERERERQRQDPAVRELEDIAAGEHVACADAELATIDLLLDDVTGLLSELASFAARARDDWPAGTSADELRAVFEAVRNTALESRTNLHVARGRVVRYREADHHLHVVGGRVVHMVEAEPEPGFHEPSDDIPF